MTPSILIVGGGPSGLVVALELLRYGVAFRMIKKRAAPGEGSKALSVNSQTLRLLDTLDISERLLEHGHKTERVTLLYDGSRLLRADLRRLVAKHPYFLMQPQPQTEAILRDAVRERACGLAGVEVGTELLDVRVGGDAVRTTMRTAAGRLEHSSFDHVIACDGARSVVRQRLGIGFAGHDYDLSFVLADAEVTWDGPRGEAFYFVTERTFLILIPLGGRYHRLVAKVDRPYDHTRPPTMDDVHRAVEECVPGGLRLSEPIWISSAPFYNRLASDVRREGVFLVGDAAHLFSPIGGLGMNTGIADAVNIGWRLGCVASRRAPAAVMDGFATERATTARALVAHTDLLTSLIARLGRHTAADERRYLPRMANRAFRREVGFQLAGLAQSYDGRPTAASEREARVGAPVPYHAAVDDALVDRRDGRHCLLATLPEPTDEEGEARETLRRATRDFERAVRVTVLERGTGARAPIPGTSVVTDRDDHIRRALGLEPGQSLLVRPDLVVERIGPVLGSGSVQAYLAERFHGSCAVTRDRGSSLHHRIGA